MNRILISLFIFTLTVFAQTGLYKSYHSNGEISAEISYSDGIYDGTSYWYYENGNLKEEKTYSNGKLNGWVRKYYESGLLKEEYFVDNGVIDGSRKRYFDNGALEFIKDYEDGKLISTKKFDYDPRYEPPISAYYAGSKERGETKKNEEDFLCDVKICPSPVGGIDAIYDKIEYPEHAKLYGLEGTVTLIATINEEGRVEETRLVKGIGLGCDEAAVNAVKNTKFLPGQDENGVVVSNLTLNIKFELPGEVNPVPVGIIDTKEKEIIKKSTEVITPETGNSDQKVEEKKIVDETTSLAEPAKPDKEHDQTKPIIDEADDLPAVDNKDEFIGIKETQTDKKKLEYFRCDDDVDVCSKPAGGIPDIIDNFIIPSRVKENNVKGDVVIEAVIDENGQVQNTEVLSGLPHGCSVAVEVAILNTKFEPALKNGKPVQSKVIITVPVDY